MQAKDFIGEAPREIYHGPNSTSQVNDTIGGSDIEDGTGDPRESTLPWGRRNSVLEHLRRSAEPGLPREACH